MTNLLNSHEAQILTDLMQGIIEGGYEWGSTIVADVLVYVETSGNSFKFIFVAGVECFTTKSYKNAVMALKTALSAIPC